MSEKLTNTALPDETSTEPASSYAFQHLAIIGLGLIGASIAAALKKQNYSGEVYGVDTDSRTRVSALERGWVTCATELEDPRFEDFVRTRCDLVIVATPVAGVDDIFAHLKDWDFKGVVTDTISTKAHILDVAQRELPYPDNYIPGHPMSGSEKSGIDAARADLFEGAHWILCPDAHTAPEHFQRMHEFVTRLGARVVSLPREEHDDAIAVVSHVPHFVASSLVQLASRHADEQQSLMRLAAGGFKDTTRVAAGSPKLWCGIAFDNAKALSSGLHEMSDILSNFAQALESGNKEELTRLLAEAAEARRALPSAWVPSSKDLLEVRIPMTNRMGVVAEVTTIASSVGCNIQSIEIDHVTEDRAVLSLILTDEGDVGQLSLKLIKAGFAISFRPLGQGGEVQ